MSAARWPSRARLGAARALLRLGQWKAAATFLGGNSGADSGAGLGAAQRLVSLIHRHYVLPQTGLGRWRESRLQTSAGRAFNRPTGVAASSDGRVMVGDEGGKFVLTLHPDGTVMDVRTPFDSHSHPWFDLGGARYALTENRVFAVDNPRSLAFTFQDGNETKPIEKVLAGARGPYGKWYLVHEDGKQLSVFSADRAFERVLYAPARGKILDLAVTPDGDLLALEERSDSVLRFGAMTGTPPVVARGDWDRPQALAVDDAGMLYVLDRGRKMIHVFGPDGAVLDRLGPSLPGNVELDDPGDLAVDGTGRLFVADRGQRGLAVLR